jgi:hypothetical protein
MAVAIALASAIGRVLDDVGQAHARDSAIVPPPRPQVLRHVQTAIDLLTDELWAAEGRNF